MTENDIVERTGLSKRGVIMYRVHCGVVDKVWTKEALGKLEGYLGVDKGSLSDAVVDKGTEEELMISRIYPNPVIVGVRRFDCAEIMRCRIPAHRKFRVGMMIKCRLRQGDLWEYVGVVKGQ